MLLSGLGGVFTAALRDCIKRRCASSSLNFSFLVVAMVKTPYGYEGLLSDQDFQKIGQFACRWAYIEHTISNCLRVILEMEPEDATVMIFPLTLDTKMARISELARPTRLTEYQLAVFAELTPLIKAMQFLRNTTLHGVVLSHGSDERIYFNLRSKNRSVNRNDLLSATR